MRASRATIILIIFAPLIFFGGACAENDSANAPKNTARESSANSETIPQEYVEDLAKIVKLDVLPEEATYTENDLSSGKRLVAVLKYSAENAAQVAARAGRHKPAEASDIDAETWFPAELIAQSQLTGDEFLKGSTYAANDFLQTPFTNGKLTRINDTDYFILELTTF